MIEFLALTAPFLLGVSYAALPGVVNTECLRRGMAHGFSAAVRIQAGALIGDAVWAVLALSGAALILRHQAIGLALGLIGAGFLFNLARAAFTSAFDRASSRSGPPLAGSSLGAGVVFSLANPAGLAFWTGIGGGTLGAVGTTLALDNVALFLFPFLAGNLAWGVGLSALVSWGRRFARPRVFRVIDAFCGLALSYFGVRLLLSTMRNAARWLTFARPLMS